MKHLPCILALILLGPWGCMDVIHTDAAMPDPTPEGRALAEELSGEWQITSVQRSTCSELLSSHPFNVHTRWMADGHQVVIESRSAPMGPLTLYAKDGTGLNHVITIEGEGCHFVAAHHLRFQTLEDRFAEGQYTVSFEWSAAERCTDFVNAYVGETTAPCTMQVDITAQRLGAPPNG